MVIGEYTILYNNDFADTLLNLASLAVTFYFTWQLVRNDNKRDEVAEKEKLSRMFKNKFISAGSGASQIQGVGKNLCTKFPKEIDLVFEAYFDLSVVYAGNLPTFIEFKKFMEDIDIYPSKDFKF